MSQGAINVPPKPPLTRETAYKELVDAFGAIVNVVNSGILPTDQRIRLTLAYLGVQSVARELMSIPPPSEEP